MKICDVYDELFPEQVFSRIMDDEDGLRNIGLPIRGKNRNEWITLARYKIMKEVNNELLFPFIKRLRYTSYFKPNTEECHVKNKMLWLVQLLFKNPDKLNWSEHEVLYELGILRSFGIPDYGGDILSDDSSEDSE